MTEPSRNPCQLADDLPPLPEYVYGRECGENEKVVPLERVRAYGDARVAAAVAQERGRWLPVLQSSVDAMEDLTRHFTKTPSTLLDSTARGNAHTAMAETRAAIRKGE